MSNESDIVGGRYEVGELLGEGAFAFTYRARDFRLDRDVALKILRSTYARDATFAARFTREAMAVATVSHRNVVQVYDHGPHEDTLYIAMEFVGGRTLRQLRRDAGGQLAAALALDIIIQVLRGLQAVHRAGIIHRDIKPDNILVGWDGIARVADFGIATDATGVNLTMTGTTLGTAAYMAPEQARGEPLIPAADLYSVGVVLYELVTGRLPFRPDNAVAMMLAHQQATPTSLRQAAPEAVIPARLEAGVMVALAKNPHARYATARAMEQALIGSEVPDRPSMADRTARIQTVQLPRQPSQPPPRVPTRPRVTPSGRPWLLGLALLVALIGSALVAAWWSEWGNGGGADPTSTPRLIEAAPDRQSATQVSEPTAAESELDPPTEGPAQFETAPPIVSIGTDTPPAIDEPLATAEPVPTESDSSEPTRTSTLEPPWTPTADGQSPPIVPVD